MAQTGIMLTSNGDVYVGSLEISSTLIVVTNAIYFTNSVVKSLDLELATDPGILEMVSHGREICTRMFIPTATVVRIQTIDRGLLETIQTVWKNRQSAQTSTFI